MLALTRAEEVAWRDKVHEMQLAALELRRAASIEERAYREYLVIKYGAAPEPGAQEKCGEAKGSV